MEEDDRFHPKEVMIGARNQDGAMCVEKDRLREKEILKGEMRGVPYATVYDPVLDTGYVYRNPDSLELEHDGEEVILDGSAYDPLDLPLEREIAFDAMWFAWSAFYPSTAIHE